MKRILLLIAICLPMMAMAQKKVAVYVTSDDPKVDNAQKEIIGGELVAAIVQTKQYKAVERTADFLKQISKEQGYQHSGNVDDDQISALGKQFGVDYVCVATIIPYKNTYYIQARMIDVETATVHAIARETSTLASPNDLMTAAGFMAHTLVSPDTSFNVPTADKYAKTDKDRVRSAKARSTTTEKPEDQIVRNSYSERHVLNMKEFSYGTTQMDRKAYADFLYSNCPEAFIKYYKGNQMITAGWVLFGVGIPMNALGWIFWLASPDIADALYPNSHRDIYPYRNNQGEHYNEYWDDEYWEYHTVYAPYDINQYLEERHRCDCVINGLGMSMLSIGMGATCTSIVILPIGYTYRNKVAMKRYNERCAYKRTASCTINLQSSRDGIGIALTF